MHSALLLAAMAFAPAVDPSTNAPNTIAYSNKGVWLIDADTKSTKRITDELEYDRPLVWSPNGSRLLFWKHSAIGWDIWSIDADGKNAKNLTNVKTGGCRSARFSPDGKLIAFMRDQPNGLYVMNADASNQRRLTNQGERDEAPSWSPDGKRIAYVVEEAGNAKTMLTTIHVIDVDGKNDRRITTAKASSSQPIWSKDGGEILFQGNRNRGRRIIVINSDGTQERILIQSEGFAPVWSPDETRFAFYVPNGNSHDLMAVSRVRVELKTLATVHGRPESASWSADGQRLAFVSQVNGRDEVFIVGVHGDNLQQITTAGGSWPAWRPRPAK